MHALIFLRYLLNNTYRYCKLVPNSMVLKIFSTLKLFINLLTKYIEQMFVYNVKYSSLYIVNTINSYIIMLQVHSNKLLPIQWTHPGSSDPWNVSAFCSRRNPIVKYLHSVEKVMRLLIYPRFIVGTIPFNKCHSHDLWYSLYAKTSEFSLCFRSEYTKIASNGSLLWIY